MKKKSKSSDSLQRLAELAEELRVSVSGSDQAKAEYQLKALDKQYSKRANIQEKIEMVNEFKKGGITEIFPSLNMGLEKTKQKYQEELQKVENQIAKRTKKAEFYGLKAKKK